MDAKDLFDSACPGREVLDHLTSRWGVLVLVALKDGPLRFHLLRDTIGGISEKMLSQTLRVLGRDGLLDRFVEPTTPPRVTYSLTPLGQEAVTHLRGLVDWIARSAPDILAAQEKYDGRG
ncbi:winged helix-turn-helix transcriptional regulator [Nonomuraea zeae]|uniref:Helix-turn-helix transcriptional regulator n=1 Tax=Nonomuraea zeae TaxID=1642303 RepID=A0A5S4GEQ5_9ACTN|nr:helix-turn-helix domain-containing protein [Nonomuraea zeae]TMR31455.1 helix-turn-helix transcriptional regulator [Nonomuraea zeae]